MLLLLINIVNGPSVNRHYVPSVNQLSVNINIYTNVYAYNN